MTAGPLRDRASRRSNREYDNAIRLDACADSWNAKTMMYNYMRRDGLSLPWDRAGVTWCNPPWSAVPSWVAKAALELNRGCASVLWLPARTDQRWWPLAWALSWAVDFVVGRPRHVPPLGARLVGRGASPTEGVVVCHLGAPQPPRGPLVRWRRADGTLIRPEVSHA